MDRTAIRTAVLLSLVVGLTAAVYWPALSFGTVYEDHNGDAQAATGTIYPGPLATDSPAHLSGHLTDLVHEAVETPFRSLTRLSFILTNRWIDQTPTTAHAVNLGLHLLNGALLGAILLVVAPPMPAVLGVAYFLLWPLQLETVAYLAGGRSELVMTFWAFAAILAVVVARGPWGYVGAVALASLAVTGKEAGIAALGLVVLAAWRFRHSDPTWPRAMLLPALMGVLAGVWELRWILQQAFREWADGWGLHMLRQCASVVRLSAAVVWPVGLSVDHDFGSVAPAWAVVAFGLCLSVLGLVWIARASRPALYFTVLFVALCVLPRVLLPSTEYLTEHHFYLPMAGVAIGWATCERSL